MHPAYIQLVAKCSSPSICDARATGCPPLRNKSAKFESLKHVRFSGPSTKLLIQKYTKMTAVGESDSSLAAKCLDLCQVLAGQGLAFNFSLSVGSTFSFSLEARGKGQALVTQGKTKKKKTPSTLRRNARRRTEFLKKKLEDSP